MECLLHAKGEVVLHLMPLFLRCGQRLLTNIHSIHCGSLWRPAEFSFFFFLWYFYDIFIGVNMIAQQELLKEELLESLTMWSNQMHHQLQTMNQSIWKWPWQTFIHNWWGVSFEGFSFTPEFEYIASRARRTSLWISTLWLVRIHRQV